MSEVEKCIFFPYRIKVKNINKENKSWARTRLLIQLTKQQTCLQTRIINAKKFKLSDKIVNMKYYVSDYSKNVISTDNCHTSINCWLVHAA